MPFRKLQCMGLEEADNHVKYIQWLMRADDDVYIKPDELVRFLKGVNDSRSYYIGQPGYGRHNEKGKLGLFGAFCMGGPGVIMSAQLLQALISKLPLCVRHVETSHEDTELGRCIAKSVGIPCTQAYEMQHLFYQNYDELNLPNSSFKKELGQSELRALTLHPVKEAPYVFRLDNYLNQHKLKILEEKLYKLNLQTNAHINKEVLLHKTLQMVKRDSRSTTKSYRTLHAKLVNLDNITSLPKHDHHLHPLDYWECIKGTTIHSPRLVSARMIFPVRHRGRQIVKDNIIKIVQEHQQLLRRTEAKRQERILNFQYQKFSPYFGIEGLAFVNIKGNGTSLTKSFLYQLPFDKDVSFRDADETTASLYQHYERIVMVLTLFQRTEVYRNFLDMFKKAVSGYPGPLELRVVIFKDVQDEHKDLIRITNKFQAANSNVMVEAAYSSGNFSRGRGLMQGLQGVRNGSLILFMDSDMTFSSRFLRRVSANTILGRQAFFPIYFTRYNPTVTCYKQKDCNISTESREEEVGFWRSYSYGIASIYKSDVMRCGGFRTNITGWGLEDVDLYEKCLNTGLNLMRVIDPGIVHRYHARECDPSLPETQLNSCHTSGAKMMGSVKRLGWMIQDLGID